MPRLIRLSILIIAIAGCGWTAAAHAAVYGSVVDGDFTYYLRGQWTLTQVESSLARLRASGGTVARSDSHWAETEPKAPVHGRHRYDWGFDDLIVTSLAQARLTWEPMLAYTPTWAQQHIKPLVSKTGIVSPIPPADNDVYGAYVAAFARRYGVGGSFWKSHPELPREPVTVFEIWNEPDDRWTWGPDVNLQDYARLYAVARQAIKRVDPHSTVITAGLAFTPSSLPRLLKALKGMAVDGFALHPYTANAASTISQVKWAEAQMQAYGRGSTPLIINEFGWTSERHAWQSVPKKALERDVIDSILGLSRIRQVSAIIPFEWTDSTWGLSEGGLAKAITQARARRR